MTEPTFDPSEGPDSSGPVIRDRRRLDPQTGKVGLSLKQSMSDPWKEVETKYPVGERISLAFRVKRRRDEADDVAGGGFYR